MFLLLLNEKPVYVAESAVALFERAQQLFGGVVLDPVTYRGRCGLGAWCVVPVQRLESEVTK